jgi:hypothetical protein
MQGRSNCTQLANRRTYMIKVIQNQPLIVRIGLRDFQFVKPYLLYDLSGGLVRPTFKQGRLVWNICGKQISYNKIKSLL